MIDHDLDRRLSDCQELLHLWHNFHKYFALAVKGGDLITHEREAEFLNLKSRIAMLHDSLMATLKHDQAIGQHVLSLVERSITLKHIHKLSIAEIKKMEIEWHEAYLLLSETVASMEERREELEKINPTTFKMNRIKNNTKNFIVNTVSSLWFKVLCVLLAIPIGIIILNAFVPIRPLFMRYGATRSVWYGFEGVLRSTISPNIPYDRFSDIKRNTSEEPEGFERDGSDFNQYTAATLVSDPAIQSFLQGSDVRFECQSYKMKDYQKLHIMIFLVSGDDSNRKAEDQYELMRKWHNSLDSNSRTFFDSYNDFFRLGNAIIILHSPVQSARKTILELGYNITSVH